MFLTKQRPMGVFQQNQVSLWSRCWREESLLVCALCLQTSSSNCTPHTVGQKHITDSKSCLWILLEFILFVFYLIGRFSWIQTLWVNGSKIQSSIGRLEEICLFPQLHRFLIVVLILLIIPGQGIECRSKTL